MSTWSAKSEIFTIQLLHTEEFADLHFEYSNVMKEARPSLIFQITGKYNYLMLDMVAT